MRIGHIRNKLILASLVVILPFIIWNAVAQFVSFQTRRSEALSDQQDTATSIANLFITYSHGIVALSRASGADLWNEQGVLRPDASAHLARVSASIRSVRCISAADPGGRVRASSAPDLLGVDYSGDFAVSRVAGGSDWALSEVFMSRIDRHPAFGVATGVRAPDRRLLGIVLVLVDEDTLRRVLGRGLMGTSHAVITDRSGTLALISGEPEGLPLAERQWGGRPFIQRALGGNASTIDRLVMPDGHVLMGAVVPVPEVGWTAGVFTPREDVVGPIRDETIRRSLLTAVLTGFLLGLAVFLGNMLARPILELAGTVRAFGEGRLSARADIRTGDEVEFLGGQFNAMADALESRQTELTMALEAQEGQSRQLETLYSAAEGLVVTTSLADKLQVIARALARLTEVRRCVVLLRKGDTMSGTTGWGIMYPEVLASYSFRVSDTGEFRGLVQDFVPVVIADATRKPWIPSELPVDARPVSVLVIPLSHAGRFVGAAVLDNPGEYTTFSLESIEATRSLAGLAAVAIENAQLFEREQHIAHVLQQGLLPIIPLEVRSLRFGTGYYPALEFAEVGGDFYDFMELPDGRIGIVIADISGKGLEAAVYTAMGKYTMRAFASEDPSPASVLTRTNQALVKSGREWGFVTALYGVIDPDTCTLTYGNAGHPPAVLLRSSGEVSCIPCPGQQPPLGVFANIEYVDNSLVLRSGDMLIGYTDGLIEARADNQMFEIDRLCSLVSEHHAEEPEELVDTIYSAVCEFSDRRLADDIAILIIKAK